jgi:hypothetical protein
MKMDQVESDYLEMAVSVSQIDPAAADYLLSGAMALPYFELTGDLASAFFWSTTPQGISYWSHIYKQLAKRQCPR